MEFVDIEKLSSKEVICHLLRKYYDKGWFSGSGGGISIRENDDCIYIAPSGVQKEYVKESDIYKFNIKCEILENPQNPILTMSQCTPLFMAFFQSRKSGATIHSHSINAFLVTSIFDTEFHCIDFEMIKGIKGHSNTEWCTIPIIDNTENECELTDSLKFAIIAYPRSHAVLVRNHGVYVCGQTWKQAKIHAECYDYLFQACVQLKQMNIQLKSKKQPSREIRAWYIDESKSQDIRDDLQGSQCDWVTLDYLKSIGIEYWKCPIVQEVDKIASQRNYKNRDEVRIGLNVSDNYQQLLVKFKNEHLHIDEEVRYIIDGSGYFDVRDHQNKWIRIQVKKWDLIVLPEGIYHRFTTDRLDYTHAMRLFKEEPKWTPYSRDDAATDKLNSRQVYIDTFISKNFN